MQQAVTYVRLGHFAVVRRPLGGRVRQAQRELQRLAGHSQQPGHPRIFDENAAAFPVVFLDAYAAAFLSGQAGILGKVSDKAGERIFPGSA
jgi:hypothetical protein